MHRSFATPAAMTLLGLFAYTSPAPALKLLTEENPPLNYTQDQQLTGMATEVVQEMGRRAKLNFDFEVMTWDRAYEKAQADRETCLYSTARLANRENAFKWVGPIAVNKWGLFALAGFTPAVKSLADAKTEFLKQSGVSNIFELQEDRLNPARLTLDRKEPQKIDLWITSVANAKQIAAQAKVTDIQLVYVVREAESYLACNPRTAAETLKALSAALKSMKKDGSYGKIIRSYESQ